jgi:hypothetical protein
MIVFDINSTILIFIIFIISKMNYQILSPILYILLIVYTSQLPNTAKYITQSGRSLNIANRGLTSIFPGNTL